MSNLRVFNKSYILLLSLVGSIAFLAGGALADLAPLFPDPTARFGDAFIFLFLINFPINVIAYILFLTGVLVFRKNSGLLTNSLPLCLLATFVVSALATICGAVIDLTLVIPAFSQTLSPYGSIPIALLLIFFTFFLLAWLLQRIQSRDAALIGVGMSLLNAVGWSLRSIRGLPTIDSSQIMLAAYPISLLVITVFAWRYVVARKAFGKISMRKAAINKHAILVCGLAAVLIVGAIGFVSFASEPGNFPSYIKAEVEKDEAGWMINITEVEGGYARLVDLVFVIANDSEELVKIDHLTIWEGDHILVDPLTGKQRLYPVIIVNKSGYCLYFYPTESTYPYHHFGKVVIAGDSIYAVNNSVMRSGYILRIVGSDWSVKPGKILYERALP